MVVYTHIVKSYFSFGKKKIATKYLQRKRITTEIKGIIVLPQKNRINIISPSRLSVTYLQISRSYNIILLQDTLLQIGK